MELRECREDAARGVKCLIIAIIQKLIIFSIKQSISVWRVKWEVDDLESWTPPKVCTEFCPHGTCGFDKDGSVLIIIPFSGIDIWGLLHSASKHDIIKYTIMTLESELKPKNVN